MSMSYDDAGTIVAQYSSCPTDDSNDGGRDNKLLMRFATDEDRTRCMKEFEKHGVRTGVHLNEAPWMWSLVDKAVIEKHPFIMYADLD